MIPHGAEFPLEVIADTPMNYQINLQGKEPPCRVSVSYKHKSPQEDLLVYYSFCEREPDEMTCHSQFKKPKMITIHSQTPGFFTNDNVYLTFKSQSGCQITLTVSFEGDNPLNQKKRKK